MVVQSKNCVNILITLRLFLLVTQTEKCPEPCSFRLQPPDMFSEV